MIQVYTGNGKGKTTAALGLAIRAAGAGLKVHIVQFVKARHCHELNSLARIKNITIRRFGRACFIKKKPSQEDIALARKGLKVIDKILRTKKVNLLILDEINIAIKLKLLDLKEVIALLKIAPEDTELVLTGRFAHPEIVKLADLVSEIREIKHYFKKGVRARKGIEY